MKPLRSYIKIRKGKAMIIADDETFPKIFKEELENLGMEGNFNHIDVSNVTFFKFDNGGWSMLHSFPDYFNGDISNWDTSNIENFNDLFRDCKNFNCDLSNWDTSNAKLMSSTFLGCKKFNQDISGWDYSHVKNMNSFLQDAESFDQDMSKINIKENVNCVGAFLGTKLTDTTLPKVLVDNRVGKLNDECQEIVDVLGNDIVKQCHSIRMNRGGSLEIILNNSLGFQASLVKFIIYFETPNQIRTIRKQNFICYNFEMASKLWEKDYFMSPNDCGNWMKQYINKRLK